MLYFLIVLSFYTPSLSPVYFIYLSTDPSYFHLSVNSLIRTAVTILITSYSPFYTIILKYIHHSIYPSFHISIDQSINHPLYPSTTPVIPQCIHHSITPFIDRLIHPLFHVSINRSIHHSVCPLTIPSYHNLITCLLHYSIHYSSQA